MEVDNAVIMFSGEIVLVGIFFLFLSFVHLFFDDACHFCALVVDSLGEGAGKGTEEQCFPRKQATCRAGRHGTSHRSKIVTSIRTRGSFDTGTLFSINSVLDSFFFRVKYIFTCKYAEIFVDSFDDAFQIACRSFFDILGLE